MSDINRWAPLARDLWMRGADLQGFHFQTNSTSAIINQLKFAAAKQIRTSFIILASFNVAVAFATAAAIFWESYTAARRANPDLRLRSSIFTLLGPAETFPFILSCGIVVQGIVFAVVQSKGLEGLMILGCAVPSQFMLPALFATSYIQVVFAIETAVRSFNTRPFSTRKSWSMIFCLACIGLGITVTGIITTFVRPPNFCFASLFWLLQRWKSACFGLLTAIAIVFLITGATILFKLRTHTRIDITERLAASRMVYFLGVGVISNALMIPFFYIITFNDPRKASSKMMELSMVAGVVANLSGLINGSLYFFLRSSRFGIIGPRGGDRAATKEFIKSLRIRTASNCDFGYQINQPISPPRLRRTNSDELLIQRTEEPTEDEEKRIESPISEYSTSPSLRAIAAPDDAPRTPEPAKTVNTERKSPPRKRSYSVFPTTDDVPLPKATFLLPSTAYAPSPRMKPPSPNFMESLVPPPLMHVMGHRRDSSLVSSATVQIGLRFSSASDMPPPSPAGFRNSDEMSRPGSPKQLGVMNTRKPSPLCMNLANIDHERRPSIDGDGDLAKDRDDEVQPEVLTLSPDIYVPEPKPQVRVTSPQGPRLSPTSSRSGSPRGKLPEKMKDGEQDWI